YERPSPRQSTASRVSASRSSERTSRPGRATRPHPESCGSGAARALTDGRATAASGEVLSSPSLAGTLGLQPALLGRAVVHVDHRRGDRVMAGLLVDEPVHLLAHPAVRGMALRRG